jgi:hypothetical protein
MHISNFLAALDDDAAYRRYFMDPVEWRPYVLQVCQRHNLQDHGQVCPGLAGSFPTFIVDEKWIVKFFGRLFDGVASFQAEVGANRLVGGRAYTPPRLLHDQPSP